MCAYICVCICGYRCSYQYKYIDINSGSGTCCRPAPRWGELQVCFGIQEKGGPYWDVPVCGREKELESRQSPARPTDPLLRQGTGAPLVGRGTHSITVRWYRGVWPSPIKDNWIFENKDTVKRNLIYFTQQVYFEYNLCGRYGAEIQGFNDKLKRYSSYFRAPTF